MYSTTSPPGQLKDDPMDLRNGFDIKRYIRTIPDYPKPGILFRDITTLLADPHGFRACTDELMWPFLRQHIDYVVGIEARGFILGGAMGPVTQPALLAQSHAEAMAGIALSQLVRKGSTCP